ncbi:four-carbon acid sugar kinase family protein [Robbsia andropogonis]|uniref:four-carbon acid sugar kinase family protein n=1 Tax=Robbsia andropogonis TaxID=28092 RepID=UPI0020A009F7|nr:four-carbon acid sugar kinase family protein [Robbsia andropogonis]MCP1119554.1 four-carbon acid sugar kinase family protein [Robbsia andropogonis]MCP1129537.1 four-carbon acid sugar kinase family protein [Robbsia andropogonis]
MIALFDAVQPADPDRAHRMPKEIGLVQSTSLLILADDLSGAADCAATAVRYGADAQVVLASPAAPPALSRPSGDTGAAPRTVPHVLAIDLDSRRMTPSEAARIHRDAVMRGNSGVNACASDNAGAPGIFKKVDSTLRGHLAAEVAALAPLLGLAIVAPALPEAGRTTEGGRQLLHGIPVEDTEVWRNERLSGTGDLVVMLSATGLRVRHQPVSSSRANARDAWRHAVHAARVDGMQALVCDAVSLDDLDAIANATASMRDVFWVGSAGLARSLTRALGEAGVFSRVVGKAADADASISADTARATARTRQGALFVVGSMSSVSHGQIADLQETAGAGLVHVAIEVSALLDTAQTDDAASLRRSVLARVSDTLCAGHDVVVSLAQQDRSRVGDGYRLAQAFGAWLAPIVTDASAIFATGGETARALLWAAGITAFTLEQEIAPGVPVSWTTTTTRDPCTSRRLPIVTKAGAFGDQGTLVRVWRHLKKNRQDS